MRILYCSIVSGGIDCFWGMNYWVVSIGLFLYFPPALFKSLDSLEVDLEKGELRKNRRFREKMYHWIIEELKNQLFNLFPWDFRITEIAKPAKTGHLGRTNQSLTSFKTHQTETVILKYIHRFWNRFQQLLESHTGWNYRYYIQDTWNSLQN